MKQFRDMTADEIAQHRTDVREGRAQTWTCVIALRRFPSGPWAVTHRGLSAPGEAALAALIREERCDPDFLGFVRLPERSTRDLRERSDLGQLIEGLP